MPTTNDLLPLAVRLRSMTAELEAVAKDLALGITDAEARVRALEEQASRLEPLIEAVGEKEKHFQELERKVQEANNLLEALRAKVR